MNNQRIEVDQLQVRVTAHYARETALLDDRRYHDWLELLDDDVRYVMPMHELRQGPPSGADETLPTFHLFNDTKATLQLRVKRLDTGLSLTDQPPSLTQRLVTDIFIESADDTAARVRSSFLVYEVRDETNTTLFAGRRTDSLRYHKESFRLLRRDILLAQFVLPRSISVFF